MTKKKPIVKIGEKVYIDRHETILSIVDFSNYVDKTYGENANPFDLEYCWKLRVPGRNRLGLNPEGITTAQVIDEHGKYIGMLQRYHRLEGDRVVKRWEFKPIFWPY